jgi:glycosyltransferase involved in cell wall biosynthesis
MRRVLAIVKRVPRLAKNLLQILNQLGGIRDIRHKAVEVLKNEGLSGVRNRLNLLAVADHDYSLWVSLYDTLNNVERTIMRSRSAAFTTRPVISVLMLAYNSNPKWLATAIESIRGQIYSNWELCIAADASNESIAVMLKNYAAKDTRIKITHRKQNRESAVTLNSLLAMASGEWITTLGHHDLLNEHALFWVAHAINRSPDICLIYSDEDRINKNGKRFSPYFKCDWNLDLFYSQNLISHLAVYRAQLLKTVEGFRVGFEGSHDYDLALRCIEQLPNEEICHIPRVLYHRRVYSRSHTQSVDFNYCAAQAGKRALCEHLARQGLNARAEMVGYGYRVRYALPPTHPLVSLIIPTKNGLCLVKQCVESILSKTTYQNYEILIMDNGSDESAVLQYFDQLKRNPKIRVLRDDRPFNFSALNNSAAKLARGEILGLLNNDLEVITPEWLSEMVSLAMQRNVGAVGAKLLYSNNTLQHAGVLLLGELVAGHAHKHWPSSMGGYAGRANLIQGFSALTGACLLVRKSIYDQVGGLDEENLHVAFNDVDFCLRLKAEGYRNVWTPYAALYHHESTTRGYENTPEKLARFEKERQYMKRRWSTLLMNDPAYNPNLTMSREDYSLAWPPRTHGVM